jgi:hypothetical protein
MNRQASEEKNSRRDLSRNSGNSIDRPLVGHDEKYNVSKVCAFCSSTMLRSHDLSTFKICFVILTDFTRRL